MAEQMESLNNKILSEEEAKRYVDKSSTGNISKRRREDLLNKIREIRVYISASSQDQNTANLLSYLSEIEKDINGKKYGLIFEEHKEEIDEVLKENIPILSEEIDLFIDNGEQMNFLIEGDNLASLKLLEKTHKGRIDLIYIDPPYNRGKEDFIYNDDYIGIDDAFRHSKWLSFIEKRLTIASSLLNEKGIILISIDDNEYAALKILCDDVLGDSKYVATLIWQKKTGASDAKGIATITEYVLVYCNDTSFEKSFSKNTDSYDLNRYRYKDEFVNERGPYYIDNLDRGGLSYSDSLNYGIKCPDGTITYPNGRTEYANDGWIWKWGKEKVSWALDNKFIEFRKTDKKQSGWSVCYKNYLKVNNENKQIERSAPHKNLITDVLNANATANIKEIFGTSSIFKYSKPVDLIKKLVSYSNEKNAMVLDFFAGSGTTGHAVMKLNAEDGGNRKFILCTNNENNICRDVTYERIKRVIEKKGYSESLKYFKVKYVPISNRLYYEYADELLEYVKELVELENGINFNGNSEIAIVLTDEELADFVDDDAKLSSCNKLYMGHEILPTSETLQILRDNNIEMNIIPDYYYNDLQEY